MGGKSFRTAGLNWITSAGIGIRCFTSGTLFVLVMCIHMYLFHKAVEGVLTVLVPFPNSSMRTNELPVLLLRAWAIWKDTHKMIHHA